MRGLKRTSETWPVWNAANVTERPGCETQEEACSRWTLGRARALARLHLVDWSADLVIVVDPEALAAGRPRSSPERARAELGVIHRSIAGVRITRGSGEPGRNIPARLSARDKSSGPNRQARCVSSLGRSLWQCQPWHIIKRVEGPRFPIRNGGKVPRPADQPWLKSARGVAGGSTPRTLLRPRLACI